MKNVTNAGYTIKDEISINGNTYVLGHNPGAPASFVTWTKGGDDYYVYGHYFADEASARQDLFKRSFDDLPEKEAEQIILATITDETKAAIAEEYRMADRLTDIESCLIDALDNLDLREDAVPDLMKNETFVACALNRYHNVDHSAENEALTQALENLIKDRFPEFVCETPEEDLPEIGEGRPSLDDTIRNAGMRAGRNQNDSELSHSGFEF